MRSMADRVLLHVGAMKSGTSYIQARMFANQAGFRERGVLVPGEAWGDQVRGVLDVLGRKATSGAPVDGAWQALLDEAAGAPGTAVVSMEHLGPIPTKLAGKVVATFGRTPVDVLITARDLNRSLAAMWQETVQNGRSWTWRDYLEGAREARPGRQSGTEIGPAGRTFWRQQHIVRMVRDWSEVVGADRVTLVTVPHPGADRELLWDRFGEVLGVDVSGMAPAPRANESIGAASALVLRRFNELLDEQGLTFPAGTGIRKHELAKTVLAARKGDEPALGLPVEPWVVEASERAVAGLRSSGVRVVGDLAELMPVDVPGIDPADVPEAAITEAAIAGLAGIVANRIRRRS